MVRVRFAPSPTGYLHLGNARTALFNYLFARKNKGSFVLRIEDTDAERSREEYETALMEDLKWFGVQWDEGPDKGGPFGPYRQTERISLYSEAAETLLKEGKAYKCYCTREETAERNKRAGKNESAGYDNRCRNLTQEEIKKHEGMGKKHVLRIKVPGKAIKVSDLIRGEVTFEAENIPDFVIMKSDGLPTFHFAVVVDDYMMQITHVIRGEDHLSNTPKHIILFEAMGVAPPKFAHMSMTLGRDKTRLSKRHGATSVRAYRENGYLPEAFFNYIALLGWGTSESQDVFSREELIREFSIERCNKSNAVFDPEKLLWMNGLYIRKTSPKRILELSIPYLIQAGTLKEPPSKEMFAYLEKAVALEQEKIKLLKDVPYHINFFILDALEYEEKAVNKHLAEKGKAALKELLPVFEEAPDWTLQTLEDAVRTFCEAKGCKAGDIFHPLRVALSGKTKGPGLFELLEHLGREKTIQRIKKWV